MTASIDGRRVEPRAGETILEAARRLDIEIPSLCSAPGLEPEGGCRLCLVEIEGEAEPRAACTEPLRPGARICTESPGLRDTRRSLLTLLMLEHGELPLQPDPGGCELERVMARLDVPGSPQPAPSRLDGTHPYLRFDPARCITCRRCVHACDEIQGRSVFSIEGPAHEPRLAFGAEHFGDSRCVACGACVDVCPTAALSDRDRLGVAAPQATMTSTCGYCGVGCQVEIGHTKGRVVSIGGKAGAAVNRGHLCAKGRYAHAYVHSPDRLTRPLLRRNGNLEPVSWETALDHVATRLDEIHQRFGPDALGALSSSRSTNEAAYLLQKLFRTRFGTNHVDCCARVCHASTALALRTATGAGAASACYDDIERAELIVVAGANPTEAHPILGARVARRVRQGARLLVIDPRRIELADVADLHLALQPDTNVPLFNALAALLIEAGAFDADYLESRCEGFDAFATFLRGESLQDAASLTGVGGEALRAAADLIADTGPSLFVHGLGLSELVQGTDSVLALCNLALLTGSIGRPGAGMLPLRGQNNVQGNADMGSTPTLLTGYQSLSDPEVQARVETVWGQAPPLTAGLTLPEMFDAAACGRLRALWIQGEDVAQSDANQSHILEALERLELLVVQELFLTETARRADVVFPAAGALEQDGTFTNGERRIQRVRAAVPAPGEARPDAEVIADVAERLGCRWEKRAPADVMDEIAQLAPALFGGVHYERLEGDGLQWPCPSRNHPGTPRLHTDGFARGPAGLHPLRFRASPEHGVASHPFTLITGRVLQHYNVGSMTRRTPSLGLAPYDTLEIHPEDADGEQVGDGDVLWIESRWGRIQARARLSDRIARGTLFLSFHHPETRTNALTGPQRDPLSQCPDYKVTAVRLERSAP